MSILNEAIFTAKSWHSCKEPEVVAK